MDAIGAALKEAGEMRLSCSPSARDDRGRISDTEYVIYEEDTTYALSRYGKAVYMDNPNTAEPDMEKPAQLSKDISNPLKDKISSGLNTDSIPFPSEPAAARPPESNRSEVMLREMMIYRGLIKDNIEYEHLLQQLPYDHDRIDEMVELLVETVCSNPALSASVGAITPRRW